MVRRRAVADNRLQLGWLRFRLALLGISLGVGLLILEGRAVDLQWIQSARLSEMARHQTLRDVVIRQPRGLIEDRNGESLALSVDVDSVRADPSKVKDPAATAEALARVLKINQSKLAWRLKRGRFFAWIKRRVSPAEAAKVRSLGLPGITMVREARRFYPHRELAAQVLGMVGVDGNGLGGLELSLDHTLIGKALSAAAIRDAHGRRLLKDDPLGDENGSISRVTLTLDRTIQWITQRALSDAVLKSKAAGGMAVVLEPSTGAILAMASAPTFNPNDPGAASRAARRNRVITDIYEPGSTFKIFTLASALEAGFVTPRSVIDCEGGAFAVGGQVIHDSHAHTKLSVTEVLAKSSNIGAAKLALQLGPESLVGTLRRLGFGKRSGLRLPGEQRGLLRNASKISPLELSTIAFGQGVAVTPLQLAAAVGSIANHGEMMRPYLVASIHDAEGTQLESQSPRVAAKIYSRKTADQMAEMMVQVTRPGGTALRAAVAGFQVAGKTGTSQKVDPLTRGYSTEKRVGSFVGFIPAKAPRLIILVVIDEPQGVKYGGVVAAPAFREIAIETLRYLGIPPTEPLPASALAKQSPSAAGAADPSSPDTASAENVASLLPVAEAPLPDGQMRVPDLRGLDASTAAYRLVDSRLSPSLRGSGVVRSQSPRPGTVVAPGTPVALLLSSRSDS